MIDNLDMDLKYMGDSYPGGFSNGMTLTRSGTRGRFSLISEDDNKKVYSDNTGVTVTLNCIRDGEAERVYTSINNGSDRKLTLEMLASFVLRNIDADRVHRLQTCWSAEGKLKSESVLDLHMEPSWNHCAMRVEKFGTVGSMPVRKYFPFLALENTKTGEFVGLQLYCPSSWQIEMLCKDDDTLTVAAGLADRDFGHWFKDLAPGEEFKTPEAVIAYGKSLYEVCDKLVKAQHPAVSPVDDHMGILFNEYCTTWGNPSYDNLKKICDRLAGKGIQFLVMDSGWYGDDNWWESIGDWDVNEDKFPGGLKPIADYIRSQGMIPGIWFELEALASKSRYYNSPEYLLHKDGYIYTGEGRRFYDMESPQALEHLNNAVIGQLKKSGFGYVKIDYNDTLGIGVDGYESLGEGLRRKILATQKFFRHMTEEIPGLVVENCSSGGHRLEPSMMAVCSQASFSDAHETTAIPLIAANMHRVIKPEQSQIWAVMRKTDSEERIYYSLCNTFLGRMCLSGDIYDLSDRQWELIDAGMDFYRKASDIIKDGMTTCIEATAESYNNPLGQQLVIRKLNNRSLVIYHRFKDSKQIDASVFSGKNIIASYGRADRDFSAQAWIVE